MQDRSSDRLPALRVSHTENEVTAQKQRQVDYVHHAVPLTARVGRWQLTMSYWSLITAMCWVFFGALASTLYGTEAALIALAATIAVMSILNPLFTKVSSRGGLSTTQMSRKPLGLVGGFLTSLMMAALVTYYTVFESSTLAVSLKLYFHVAPMWVWYALVTLAILPLMLGSVQTWMARLNGLLLPIYVVGIAIVIGLAVMHSDQGTAWLHFGGVVPAAAQPIPAWAMAFCMLMGTWPLIPTATDVARFGKIEDEKFNDHVTFGFLFYLWLYAGNGLIGIYLVRSMLPTDPTQETGVVQAILAAGGLFGLILLLVTQTRISTFNFYESSMNFERFFAGALGIKLGRMTWVVIVGVLAFVLMLTDVFSYVLRALQWQSAFFVGWIAILAIHLMLNPKERTSGMEFRANRVPMVTPGLFSWLISSGIGIWLIEGHSVPPLAHALASPLTFVIAGALYLVSLIFSSKSKRGHASDVRDEVGNYMATWIACEACDNGHTAYAMDRDPNTGLPVCDECATAVRVGVREAVARANAAA